MTDTNPHTEPTWRDAHDADARAARQNLVTQSPWITPYLGLRARLSQVWINRWTVLLLLILVRVLFAIADIEDKINDARADALSSCTAMENVGSTMASAPHYMAQGINEMTATGVEKAIDGLMDMLTLTVTGVEEISIFAINVWTQTYLCLITLAISGSLHVALNVIEDVSHFLNDTIGGIGKGLHAGINGFDNDLNKAISGVDKLFGAKVPQLNVGDSLDKLDHLVLPPGLDQGLQKLNASIPNFAQVNNLTQTALRFPFEELKELIRNHTGHYTFDRSLFPVPDKQRLNFCTDDNSIGDFFDGLIHVEATARKVAIAVLVLLALGIMIPMTWWEIKRWRMAQDRAKYVDDHAFDSMDAVYVVSRPYSSMLGIETSKRVTNDYKRRTLIRWMIAYCTSTPALFVLSLGLAGLLSGFCHYLALKALTQEVPHLTQQIAHFSDKVYDTVNNVSVTWAHDTNAVILDMNNKVNHDVFGWVNTSTSALNHTLNVATDEMVGALKKVFGGTVLEDPVMEVYNCLIGLKVAGIEKGLTWAHEHAHIDFPLLANDTLSMSHLAKQANAAKASGNDTNADAGAGSSFLDDPDGQATGAVKNAVAKLVKKIEKHIRQELAISAAVVGVWLLVFLLGLGRMLWLMSTADKTRGTGAGLFGGRLGKLGSHNHSLGPKSPKSPKEGVFGEKGFEEKAAPPDPPHQPNPFDTPRFPSPTFPTHPAHRTGDGTLTREPTLPNVADNTGSNFRGQDYTLAPAPLPLFSRSPPPSHPSLHPYPPQERRMDDVPLSPKDRSQPGVRSVSGGAVAPVMGHPRTSWRPEFVGSGVNGGKGGREERMDSMKMFGGGLR